MKRLRRAGLAGFAGVSIALASLAPQPASDPAKTQYNACPTIDLETEETPPQDTPATRHMSNLGALVLGALSAECREERDNGETFRVETNRDSATLHFSRIVKIAGCAAISRPCGTVYTVSATAKSNVAGELEPTQVVSFVVVHEDYFVDAKGGTQYGLEATDIGTGWLVDATQSTEDGTLYTFTANTGGSLADIQTHEIVEDTKEVLARAFA